MRGDLSSSFAFVLPLVVLGTVRVAAADEAPPASRLEACLTSFEEAQRKERSGQLRDGRHLYEDCASPVCPREVRDDCTRGREAIDLATPTASFVVRDASGKDVSGTVLIDGRPFVAPAGRAAPIDPGEHVVEVKLAAGAAFRVKVTIAEGEKSRVVVLTAPASPAKEGKVPVGPIVLGATGVVAVSAVVALHVLAVIEERRLRDEYVAAEAEGMATGSADAAARRRAAGLRYNENEEDIRARLPLLLGLGAGGVLAIGGAIGWYALTRPSAKASLGVRPLGVAGVALEGRF